MISAVQPAADKSSPEMPAAQAVSAMLKSQAIQDLWARDYISRTDQNPAALAASLEDRALYLADHPELLSFAREFVVLERDALRKSKAAGCDELLRALDRLVDYYGALASDSALPKRDTLPENSRRLLDSIERKTAQIPFRPVRSGWNLFKTLWVNIVHDAMKNKKAFGALLGLSSAALWFMNARLGSSGTVYLDPKETGYTNLSLDTFGTDTPLISDPSLIRTDTLKGGHDHLERLIGALDGVIGPENVKAAAKTIRETLTINGQELFPLHRARVKTLAVDTQGLLQGGYDFMNTRLGWFTRDRVLDVGHALPSSHFVGAFNDAAQWMADKVYAFDTIENITIHTILFASAVKASHKLGTLDNEETRESKNKIRDFFNRTVRSNSLSYAFATAAGITAYTLGDGLNAGMIWAGFGGTLAGNAVHNFFRRRGRSHHVLSVTAQAHEKLADLEEAIGDIEMRPAAAESSVTAARGLKERFWNFKSKLALAFAGAATTVLVYADAQGALDKISQETLRETAVKASEIAGSLAGSGLVAGTYAGVNVPQDVTLHFIFLVAGGIVGTSIAGGQRGSDVALRGGRRLFNYLTGRRDINKYEGFEIG